MWFAVVRISFCRCAVVGAHSRSGSAIVNNFASASVDMYNARNKQWSWTTMQVARAAHGAVTVGNLLLLAGGEAMLGTDVCETHSFALTYLHSRHAR